MSDRTANLLAALAVAVERADARVAAADAALALAQVAGREHRTTCPACLAGERCYTARVVLASPVVERRAVEARAIADAAREAHARNLAAAVADGTLPAPLAAAA